MITEEQVAITNTAGDENQMSDILLPDCESYKETAEHYKEKWIEAQRLNKELYSAFDILFKFIENGGLVCDESILTIQDLKSTITAIVPTIQSAEASFKN